MELFKELQSIVASMETDVKKFYDKGNESAGIRVRGNLQKIKAVAQEIRFEISKLNKENKNDKRNN